MRPYPYANIGGPNSILVNSATAICAAQTTPGAANLLINGSAASGGVATLGGGNAAQIISINSIADLSTITFTITGKDANGRTLSEEVTGPDNETVKSTNHFTTVAQIAVNGAVGTNVIVGALAEDGAVSRYVPLNWRAQYFNTTLDVNFLEGSAGTATLEVTYHDPNDSTNYPLVWYPLSSFGTSTANKAVGITQVTAAVRMNMTAYTSGQINLFVLTGGYAVGG